MNAYHFDRSGGRGLIRRLAPLAAVIAIPLSGCSGLLDVDDPEVVLPETVNSAEGVPNLIFGALGDFQVAYSGGGLDDKFLSNTAAFTDELHSSGTFPTRTATDQRNQRPAAVGNTTDATYGSLHRARRSLINAARAVEQFFSATDTRIAELKALEGYTYVALAEGFCSGITFSDVDANGVRTDRPPIPTLAVFDSAIVRFNEALAIQPTNRLAAIGKARAHLNKGEFAAAAAAVATIPTTYVYRIEHSANTGREQNPIYNLNISNRRFSVSDQEGINGEPFRSANDPRVAWRDQGRGGFLSSVRLYENRLYDSFDADVPLADGVQARLIEAEAALNENRIADWLLILNDLRANVGAFMSARYQDYASKLAGSHVTRDTLPPLVAPATQAERVDLMFSERAFWLYITGHRMGDLRRLVRPVSEGGYGRSQADVFPTGVYHKGGTYSDDVAWPIPFDEENNPLYDPAGCNVDKP